jgi:hypothetical protein
MTKAPRRKAAKAKAEFREKRMGARPYECAPGSGPRLLDGSFITQPSARVASQAPSTR